MNTKEKLFFALVFTVLTISLVSLLSPIANEMLRSVRTHSYVYGYSLPFYFSVEDTSKLPPAQAVPILMYHGVIAEGNKLGANTERKAFIAQMEMLKENGYETISLKDYDQFRQGNFTLPPKPIIITFDDGRKDSFFTVDEILKKLGFKATIFIASGKAIEGDLFFLTWDQLNAVKATGRWEIEAHGRRSHEKIVIDSKGTLGSYLTSRMYIPGKGLESISEYKKRVEQDYVNSISDLKEHLGITSHYFAVPLNDYGDFSITNFENAYGYNQELTSRYFKFALVQAQQDDSGVLESFYNFSDADQYKLLRLEVKDMKPEVLLQNLENFSPKPPSLKFTQGGESLFMKSVQLLFGKIKTDKGITLLSSTSLPAARITIGDKHWKNYTIEANIVREKGRSASLIVYYTNENNFIYLDWSDKTLILTERVNGNETRLVERYPIDKTGESKFTMNVEGNTLSAYFNGVTIADKIPIKLSAGAAGFSVWDPNGAQASINNLEIKSLETPYIKVGMVQ